ncbi:hypothetical protein [Mesorhizobium sp.]|nr:hypothetical protein [Mesorhizobium sp.]
MTAASDLPALAIAIGGTKIAIAEVSDAGSPTGARRRPRALAGAIISSPR